MILGITLFVVGLLVSVILHEAGHFLTARHFGMKATEFFAGFGPRVWSFRRGETEYGLKAIPAGGYVKILGMTPLEELDPADQPRAFWRFPARQRAVVLAAGSVVHFIIALVIMVVVFSVVGVTENTGLRVSATRDLTLDDGSVRPSPAAQAGLLPGDRIEAVDGKPVSDFQAVAERVRAVPPGTSISITVTRDGREEVLRPTTVGITPAAGAAPVSFIGASPGEVRVRENPLRATGSSFQAFGTGVKGVGKALVAIPASIPKLFTSQEREGDGLISVYGAARLSGEASSSGPDGVALFLAILASVNVAVGVFNLLPLLPLDGGHLAVLGYEKARSAIARRLGRPDPGKVDMLKLLPAAYAVVGVLGLLSVLLIANDIVNPVANPFQ